MTEAAIYVRMSKDRTGAGLGIDRQEQDCRALAETQGWTISRVYSDNDISAASGKRRPGFEALLEDRPSRVIVWHQDRLLRVSRDLERVLDAGFTVHPVTAGTLDLSNTTGRAVARTVAVWSTYEVEHARERMVRAKEQAAAQGRHLGGRRPFGWEADGMTIREDEAQALRDAAHGLVAGRSLQALARECTVRTGTSGGQMTATALRRLLLRPRNAGLMVHRGETVGEGLWKPILDRDVWGSVVAILNDPSRLTHDTRGERRWLLSGIARCGVCDAILRGHTDGRGNRSYRCPENHVSRAEGPTDEQVTRLIVERLSASDLADLLPGNRDEGVSLVAEHAEISSRLDGLAEAFVAGALTVSQMTIASAGLRERLDAVEARLSAQRTTPGLSGLMAYADPAKAFLDAPLDVRSAVVDALLRVEINPGRKGRPPGWRPGQPYSDPRAVRATWRSDAEAAPEPGAGSQ